MRPVSAPRPAAGFSFIEIIIALAVFGIMLGIGMPLMGNWLMATKATSATEFYVEGFRKARAEAIAHNATSRITLTENATNGQLDWQVDVCYPTPAVLCSDSSGSWSTTTAPAANDPQGVNGYKSVARSAAALPKSDVLQYRLRPDGATDIYFTPLGWVDTTFSPRLTRLDLTPTSDHSGEFPSSAIAITLAGMASKCDPTRAVPDSRACPP